MEEVDELVAGHVKELVQVHAPNNRKNMISVWCSYCTHALLCSADLYVNLRKDVRAFFSPSSAIL